MLAKSSFARRVSHSLLNVARVSGIGSALLSSGDRQPGASGRKLGGKAGDVLTRRFAFYSNISLAKALGSREANDRSLCALDHCMGSLVELQRHVTKKLE